MTGLGKLWRRLRGGGTEEDETVVRFRVAVASALEGDLDRERLEALRREAASLGVPEEEVELELEMVEGGLAELDFREEIARTGLPVVAHQHKALGADRCHLIASATLLAGEHGRPGRLFVTEHRLVFLASPMLAVPWNGVHRVEQSGRDVIVAATRGATFRFRFGSFADTRKVRWLVQARISGLGQGFSDKSG
ncbi:MAG TPA: hypothetical protein VIL35_09505 [Vicinamibacterales bacterium]